MFRTSLMVLILCSVVFAGAAIECLHAPCEAGEDLLKSRDHMFCSWDPSKLCSEPFQPNTIDDCQDTPSSYGYLKSESIESIYVDSEDGIFLAGGVAKVRVKAYCYDGYGYVKDWVALYYYDGSEWHFIDVQPCTKSQHFQTFDFKVELRRNPGFHTIRVFIYYGRSWDARRDHCGSKISRYADTDDVNIFVRDPHETYFFTRQKQYKNCGNVYVKVETYDANYNPTDDTVNVSLFDALGKLVDSVVIKTLNGVGYTVFTLPYSQTGLWNIVAQACAISQKSFMVGFGDTRLKTVELLLNPSKSIYEVGEPIDFKAFVVNGMGEGVEGAKVTLQIEGVSYDMKEIGGGYYEWKMKFEAGGRYKITIIAEKDGDAVEKVEYIWIK